MGSALIDGSTVQDDVFKLLGAIEGMADSSLSRFLADIGSELLLGYTITATTASTRLRTR